MRLPFEGDNLLSIILSKAALLADDDKITDPTILSQPDRWTRLIAATSAVDPGNGSNNDGCGELDIRWRDYVPALHPVLAHWRSERGLEEFGLTGW